MKKLYHSKEIHLCYSCRIWHIAPCENWVSYWEEYFLQISILKVEQGLFFPNLPMQLGWRTTCISPKKNICVRIRSLGVYFWKKYFLQLWSFKMETGSVCSKYAYSRVLKKHMYHSKEHHVFYNIQHQGHYFSVRNDFVVQRNTSCNQNFQGGERLTCSK
jgi:hypothetical protein